MRRKSRNSKSNCPDRPEEPCSLEVATRLIDGKWKLHILRLLLYEEPMGFNQLQRSIGGISAKVLTKSLRDLETDGIVSRKVIPDSRVRVEYGVTEYGQKLRPIFDQLGAWSYGKPDH